MVKINQTLKIILPCLLIILLLQSCIPLRAAPKIEDYMVTKGDKFRRTLPEREMFVFEDPNDTNCFYHYVNTGFQLIKENV